MALWIDDMLTQQPEWYRMSGNACALLIELWSAARNSGNEGAFEVDRLARVADHYSPKAKQELIEHGWLHEEAEGCPQASELCVQIGVPGFIVLHNVAGRQESKMLASDRKKGKWLDKRAAGYAASHKQWHLDRGRPNPDCTLCQEEGLVA